MARHPLGVVGTGRETVRYRSCGPLATRRTSNARARPEEALPPDAHRLRAASTTTLGQWRRGPAHQDPTLAKEDATDDEDSTSEL